MAINLYCKWSKNISEAFNAFRMLSVVPRADHKIEDGKEGTSDIHYRVLLSFQDCTQLYAALVHKSENNQQVVG